MSEPSFGQKALGAFVLLLFFVIAVSMCSPSSDEAGSEETPVTAASVRAVVVGTELLSPRQLEVFYRVENTDTVAATDIGCTLTAMVGGDEVNDGFLEGVVNWDEDLAAGESLLSKTTLSIEDDLAAYVTEVDTYCNADRVAG